MAERPLISIAVPVFNGASPPASLSDLNTRPGREITRSRRLGRRFERRKLRNPPDTYEDPRIRLLPTLDKPNGLHANWSRVLSESRGEYVKLVCQDDLLAPGCLRRQADLLRTHPSSSLVAGVETSSTSVITVLIRRHGPRTTRWKCRNERGADG